MDNRPEDKVLENRVKKLAKKIHEDKLQRPDSYPGYNGSSKSEQDANWHEAEQLLRGHGELIVLYFADDSKTEGLLDILREENYNVIPSEGANNLSETILQTTPHIAVLDCKKPSGVLSANESTVDSEEALRDYLIKDTPLLVVTSDNGEISRIVQRGFSNAFFCTQPSMFTERMREAARQATALKNAGLLDLKTTTFIDLLDHLNQCENLPGDPTQTLVYKRAVRLDDRIEGFLRAGEFPGTVLFTDEIGELGTVLIQMTSEKQYSPATSFFARKCIDAKAFSHWDIALQRYHDSRHYRPYQLHFKLARIAFPVRHGDYTTLYVEQIIGPTITDVLHLIKRDAYKLEDSKKCIVKCLREVIIEKTLKDMVFWIENQPKKRMIQKPTPAELRDYYTQNLKQAPLDNSVYTDITLTDEEKQAWECALSAFKDDFVVKPDEIVKNFDTSNRNAALRLGKISVSLGELIDTLIPPGERASIQNVRSLEQREKLVKGMLSGPIEQLLYHFDAGYRYMHLLEDFYHIIDAPEACLDEDQRIKYLYEFLKQCALEEGPLCMWMGFYRSVRKRDLFLATYGVKNEENFRQGLISEEKYAASRRNIEHSVKHYGERMLYYLDKLIEPAEDAVKPSKGDALYKSLKQCKKIADFEAFLASSPADRQIARLGKLHVLRLVAEKMNGFKELVYTIAPKQNDNQT